MTLTRWVVSFAAVPTDRFVLHAPQICLLSTPIFFCILLLVIQQIVNILLLSSDDFKCGCKCTKCVYKNVTTGEEISGPFIGLGGCPGDCLTYDKSECGLQYSKPLQAAFCKIAHPSSWPSIQQVRAPGCFVGRLASHSCCCCCCWRVLRILALLAHCGRPDTRMRGAIVLADFLHARHSRLQQIACFALHAASEFSGSTRQ